MKCLRMALAWWLFSAASAFAQQPLPAFPGAQGGGAASLGGRGGVVIEVTNLNDNGPGSLRACIEASGPRTCVFRVAGSITPSRRLQATNPFLTVAGQTAPGGGITLSGAGLGADAAIFVSTHDVVIRYVTASIGLGNNHSPGPSTGASAFEVASGNAFNVVIDHVTARWWDNKGYVTYTNTSDPIHSLTLQWSLMYESNAAHPVGPMTDDGMGLAHLETDQDFHHNLFADTGHRLPLFNTRSLHWVNNIVYNWDYFASQVQGGVLADFIGNKYKPGNLNVSGPGAPAHAREIEANNAQSSDAPVNDMPGPPSVYLAGNIGPNQSDPNGNQWVMTATVASEGGAEVGSPIDLSWQRNTPQPAQQSPIVADSALNLDAILLPTVGNSQRLDCLGNFVSKRDSVDARIISEYQAGNVGGFFTVEDATHMIPPIDPGTLCTESQHDGIPDQWKVANGLSTTDPNVGDRVAANGYTNLENYLNGVTGAVQPTQPGVTITVSPTFATVQTGGTQQFLATVLGSSMTGVNWTATRGLVDGTGFYRAPSTAGPDSVTAVAQADLSKSATAQVQVTAPPLPPPPSGLTESNISASGITETSAVVSWTTNKASNSQVWISTAAPSGPEPMGGKWLACCNPAGVTQHSFTVTGLQPGTKYWFRVESYDGANLATSAAQTFTTLPLADKTPPAIVFNCTAQNAKTIVCTVTATDDTALKSLAIHATATDAAGNTMSASATKSQ